LLEIGNGRYKKRLESEGFGLWAKDRGFQPCGLPFYEVYHYDEWSREVDVRHLQWTNGTGPEPRVPACKPWCKEHEAAWNNKCNFANCEGCKQCEARDREWPTSLPRGNTSRPLAMACQGKPECKGKEVNICLRLEREGKCEWAPKEEIKGPGECDGPAECARKDQPTCMRLQREGKCKWKVLKAKDLVPGECVGKRGQPECDDKDKITCRQLVADRKCLWVPAPSERKTPTGTCLGPAECENKPRRTCHRLRLQEGKDCRYKPAPENEVKVKMTLKNIKLSKMDKKSQEELTDKLASKIAEKADVDSTAVNVTLTEGSIKVDATIDMEEKIGIMEAENEGKEIDLVGEMKTLKSEVQAEVGSADTAQEVLKVASEVEGVKEAAEGEVTISEPETEVTAEAATKAPQVITDEPLPAPSPSPPSPSPSPGSGSPAPAPAPEPAGTEASEGGAGEISTAVHENTFTALLLGTVAAIMMQ